MSWLLLAAVWLVGVALIAVLPPFEGFDETAHWSYIQQLADTGHIPVYGLDRLSADVGAYPGPMAAPQGQPYRDFFSRPRTAPGVAGSGPSRFAPGADFNWEAQHPPLYYALMALPYRMLATLHWRWHMFGLRLASWTIGFAGFAWGAMVTQRLLRQRGVRDARLLLPMAWPFLFAEFFPEFSRLTNDDLCLLLAAWIWWLALEWLERGASWRRALMLGAALGAGLLTKAFFLPVTAGVTVLLAVALLRGQAPRHWPIVACVPLLAGVIGGAWYLAKLRTSGTFTGSADMIVLQAQGGLLAGLRAHFDIFQYLRGVVRIAASFCSAGTWSFAHLSRLYVAPVVVLALLPWFLYARRLQGRDPMAMSPVFIVGPVLAGLLYHQLGMVAATGEGSGTPGWYLHIFAAPLSLVLALGWGHRAVMLPLTGYALLFSAAMAWVQVAFVSGCLPRAGTGTVSVSGADCLVDVAHLRLLALPEVAAFAGLAALVALAAAAVLAAMAVRPAHAGSG